MNKFNKIIFWCEFPKKIDPKRIALIDFNTEVYIAVKSVKEFNYWKKKLKNKNITF